MHPNCTLGEFCPLEKYSVDAHDQAVGYRTSV